MLPISKEIVLKEWKLQNLDAVEKIRQYKSWQRGKQNLSEVN